jgi:hypothetical protein
VVFDHGAGITNRTFSPRTGDVVWIGRDDVARAGIGCDEFDFARDAVRVGVCDRAVLRSERGKRQAMVLVLIFGGSRSGLSHLPVFDSTAEKLAGTELWGDELGLLKIADCVGLLQPWAGKGAIGCARSTVRCDKRYEFIF